MNSTIIPSCGIAHFEIIVAGPREAKEKTFFLMKSVDVSREESVLTWLQGMSHLTGRDEMDNRHLVAVSACWVLVMVKFRAMRTGGAINVETS